MPFPSRILPIELITSVDDELFPNEPAKPVAKSRLKRLFERQRYNSISRTSSGEKILANEEARDGTAQFEPSSVCLAKMVRNFIEEGDSKPVSCRRRCNCFSVSLSDSSDDEFDSSSGDGSEILKSLVPCASVCERNLLADTLKIVETNKSTEREDGNCRETIRDGLCLLGYDAAICKSRWEKSPSYPAGEYEYLDVILQGERYTIDVDFRSEFEIARFTKSYENILHILPPIYVGKSDRLVKIISVVTEAAKQSLKKKGMPFPPWRKAEYIQSKWLSPYTRITPTHESDGKYKMKQSLISPEVFEASDPHFEKDQNDCVFSLSYSSDEYDEAGGRHFELLKLKERKSPGLDIKVVTGFVPIINGNKP